MKFILSADHVTLDTSGAQLSVPLDAFHEALTQGLRVPTGILPPAVRWISTYGTAVLWERPPEVGRFTYFDRSTGESYAFQLPRPWMVYAFQFTPQLDHLVSLRIYARNGPFYSMHDPLYMMPLPNIYNNAVACLGPEFETAYRTWAIDQGAELTIASALLYAQGLLWSMDANDEVANWLNAWRLPAELPAELRVGMDDSQAHNNEMSVAILRYFERWDRAQMAAATFGASNTFIDAGDTVGVLCEFLQAQENEALGLDDPWAQLTQAFNAARRLALAETASS